MQIEVITFTTICM